MHRRVTAGAAALALLAAGGAGIATASGSNPTGGGAASGSRLDDGKDLLGQAGISESQAIAAAQGAASGALNEVDLERYKGRLVFNVDVGSSDVKVDATSGKVLSAPHDG